jgi:hypothetical protein
LGHVSEWMRGRELAAGTDVARDHLYHLLPCLQIESSLPAFRGPPMVPSRRAELHPGIIRTPGIWELGGPISQAILSCIVAVGRLHELSAQGTCSLYADSSPGPMYDRRPEDQAWDQSSPVRRLECYFIMTGASLPPEWCHRGGLVATRGGHLRPESVLPAEHALVRPNLALCGWSRLYCRSRF